MTKLQARQKNSLVKKIEQALGQLEHAQHIAKMYGLNEIAGDLGTAKTEGLRALRKAEAV